MTAGAGVTAVASAGEWDSPFLASRSQVVLGVCRPGVQVGDLLTESSW